MTNRAPLTIAEREAIYHGQLAGKKLKDISKEQNDMTFERYKNVLQCKGIDRAKNTGFRVHEQGMVPYEQKKLGLSAYYDKRCVLDDGIHTKPLY